MSSRRKQEKPQPRKNLVIGEDLAQDYLTCGVCQRDFPLCEIVRFIQHKVRSCSNKENSNNCLSKLFGCAPDDSDSEDGVIQTSRAVCKEDAEEKNHKVVSSTINTLKNTTASAKDSNKATSPKEPDTLEPCNYVCSTCKQPHTSAWSLLQHVQNHHGLKIYVDSTPSHNINSTVVEAKPSTEQNASPPSSALRAPLLERQLDPAPLFPRSSSQELRLDLLGLSSTSSHLPSVDSSPPPLLEVHQLDMAPTAASLTVANEPQLDFYSQRLRELAGATSPNALISSQMKLLQPNFKAVVNNKPNTHPANTNERHQSSTNFNTPSQLPQSSASSTTSENPPSSPKTNPKSCEFCGKCFRFMSNLIVHRRSHTGEKPFKCHICNHACTQASKLKRHMKTHKRKKKSSSSDKTFALSESCVKNGIQSSNDGFTTKNPEAQTNGESEYLSDDPSGVHHIEDEVEEDEEEEIDVEEEDVDDDDDDDDQNQPKLVVDQERDDDMVAQDLSKKPMKNGTSENNGVSKEEKKGNNAIKHSLLSEVMENIGLASIQQYSEAYKQALKESSALKHDRHSDGSASNDGANHLERPSREGTRSAGQSPLGFNTGLLSAFDQTVAAKRIKLEDHWRDKEDSSLYSGLWMPSSLSMSSYKDLYSADGSDRRKSKNESALVCMSPSSVRSSSPRPGPSNSLCTLGSIANSLLKPKDQRRNDTCEYCGKVFKNCSNLTVHRRSHTGEKPYKCELCSYACAQSSKLTRHMKTHGRMGKDVYRCRFCDMPFSVPSTLEKHMRKCVVSQSGGTSYLLTERESDSKEMTP